jgi:O-antigen/teichoic acid export membrane protein
MAFFAGAFAVINLVTPYSALGAGMLFMRYVTLDRSNAAVYWGNSLAVTAAATVLIAGALLLAGPALTKTHNALIFVVLVVGSCFPLLRGIHRTTGSALTGTGRQNLRTTSQLTVAALNFGLNLWWIPVYGWIGAAWASLASDGLLALLNSVLLLWAWRTSTRTGRRETSVLAESNAFS